MSVFNYHDRRFRSSSTSGRGEVDAETIFHYRQDRDVVWATYSGGQIRQGTLVAKVLANGDLEMRYSHVNQAGELMTGQCQSRPELLEDGRLRMHERWRWTSGDFSAGTSTLEEIAG